MPKFYYTIFTRETDGIWSPQFGDYDRALVEEEVKLSYRNFKPRDRKIVRTAGCRQWLINQAAKRLNAEVS